MPRLAMRWFAVSVVLAIVGIIGGAVFVGPTLHTSTTSVSAASEAQQAPAATPPQHLITVTGTGTINAQPDLATVSVGVTATAPTSTDAMAQVNTSLGAVLTGVKALGVADADLQTSGLSLQPLYQPRAPSDSSPAQINGYRAANNVVVTVRDLTTVGPVLDAATANGANVIGDIRFGFTSDQQLRLQALGSATDDAHAKAMAIATAAGIGPLSLQTVVAQSVSSPQPLELSAARSSVADAATPVQTGQLEINATVQETFTF